MAGEDRVDLARRVVDDVGEGAARGDLRVERREVVALGRALVVLGDDDVGLAVGRVTVLELGRDAVDRLDRVAEVETRDALRRDERRGLLGGRADDADLEPADLDDRVLVERRGGRAALVDVGTEQVEVRGLADATSEVGEAAVELVVADGAGLEPEGVEELDRRQVLLGGGGEGGGPDVVPGRQQRRRVLAELGPGLDDGAGEGLARGARAVGVDATVEVVDVEQVDRRQRRVDPARLDGVGGVGGAGRGDECGDRTRADEQRRASLLQGHEGSSGDTGCVTSPTSGIPGQMLPYPGYICRTKGGGSLTVR
ncbi:hypothetical protein [Janibacter indicus]|uniref:hypothetical protein n=1 Tax=Janibacter indicus TaxID=857417 RepID=UPI003D9AA7F2